MKNKIMELLAHLRILGLIYKEFKLLAKRKKTPLLVLSLPIIFLVIYSAGSSAITNPQVTPTVGICNYDPAAESMIESLNGDFKIQRLTGDSCIFDLKDKIKRKEIMIGFMIPRDFIERISNANQAYITYYVDDSNPLTASMSSYFIEKAFSDYSTNIISQSEEELNTLSSTARQKLNSALLILNTTSNILNTNKDLFSIAYPLMNSYLNNAISELESYDDDLSFVQGLDVNFLTKPVSFNRDYVYTGLNAASFNFSSVFCTISLFTLLLLASSGVILDKKNNYLLRIRATKTLISSYFASKIVFYLAVSLAQFLLVMGLITLQGAIFNFQLDSLLAVFAAITIINTSIGLLIGSLSENETVAILFSLTLSLPFLFLSGIFFPIEFMPDYIKVMSNIVPLGKEILLLKQASVIGLSLSELTSGLNELIIISLVLLTSTYVVMKLKE